MESIKMDFKEIVDYVREKDLRIESLRNQMLDKNQEITKLRQENNQLKEKINKAIRFIKKNRSYVSIECMEQGLLESDLNKLLQILDKVKV